MGFNLKIPLYQQFHTFFGRFNTFFSHLQICNIYYKIPLIKCYKNIYGFYGFLFEKKQFDTFFGQFDTFFSHLQIFNIDHNNRLYKYYKNIYGFYGFLFKNSSILTISHLFWAF